MSTVTTDASTTVDPTIVAEIASKQADIEVPAWFDVRQVIDARTIDALVAMRAEFAEFLEQAKRLGGRWVALSDQYLAQIGAATDALGPEGGDLDDYVCNFTHAATPYDDIIRLAHEVHVQIDPYGRKPENARPKVAQ